LFTVLLQSLVLASGGIFSVGSITLVILPLISDRGWRNGLAYMTGYVGAYTLIGIAAVSVGYQTAGNNSEKPAIFMPILFMVLGIVLLWLTQRNWRKAPSERDNSPRLFSIVDKITPPKAFMFGAFVTVVNFKNLAIFLSAVSIVLVSDLLLPSKILMVLPVVLVFCLSVIIPVLIYVSFPERANERLGRLKQTLETHSRAIGIWVPLVFGLIFLMRGISQIR
jgi:threonine/homoserine/homoserine lactone efflux protein